jgi:hypothetical protein
MLAGDRGGLSVQAPSAFWGVSRRDDEDAISRFRCAHLDAPYLTTRGVLWRAEFRLQPVRDGLLGDGIFDYSDGGHVVFLCCSLGSWCKDVGQCLTNHSRRAADFGVI